MPYIKVSPSALSSMSETLRNSSSKVGQIESDFSGVARKLDWDVRSASDIQRRMDRIIDVLEDYADLLGDMRSFIDGAKRKYEAAQKEDTKLQKLYLSKVDKAVVALDKSMMTEAEKIEERQKVANIWNWAVTIGCVVGSIAIIAATGGMAAPAVFGVMVATSTVTGMLTSATNNLTSQYVEDGFADGVDLHSLGTEVAVGTVSGLIGGVISGGMGAGASMLTAKATSSALASSNSAVRIITAAGINAGAEVVEGGLRDGAVTYIESGGDFEAAKDAALDEDWKTNAAIGAVVGGGSELLKTVRQSEIDRATSNHNKQNAVSVEEAKKKLVDVSGIDAIEEGKNGAADFSKSKYILRNKNGEAASIKIKMTGDEAADRTAIMQELQNRGFDITSIGKKGKYRLHYMSDLDVDTKECTVQIVKKSSEMKAFTRAHGSISSAKAQYRQNFGTSYDKGAKPDADLAHFVEAFADGLDPLTT